MISLFEMVPKWSAEVLANNTEHKGAVVGLRDKIPEGSFVQA